MTILLNCLHKSSVGFQQLQRHFSTEGAVYPELPSYTVLSAWTTASMGAVNYFVAVPWKIWVSHPYSIILKGEDLCQQDSLGAIQGPIFYCSFHQKPLPDLLILLAQIFATFSDTTDSSSKSQAFLEMCIFKFSSSAADVVSQYNFRQNTVGCWMII